MLLRGGVIWVGGWSASGTEKVRYDTRNNPRIPSLAGVVEVLAGIKITSILKGHDGDSVTTLSFDPLDFSATVATK